MNWTGFILILLSATLTMARAQDAAPPDLPAKNLKFLVVVDSSYSMLTRRESTMGSVQGLVSSGFQDQIRPGDKFAVWAFNEEIDSASFTPLVWDPKRADFLAREASLFAGGYGNKGRANFDLFLRELSYLSELTTNVLVVLFTDGAERLYGLPFDGLVNTAFEKEGLSLRAASRPFVVSFCMQQSRFTQGMVFAGRGPLRLPILPGQAPSETPPPAPAVVKQATRTAPRPLPQPAPVPKIERLKQTQPTTPPVVLNFPPGANINSDDTPSPLALAEKPKPAPVLTTPKTSPPTTKVAQTAATAPAPKAVVSNPPPVQASSEKKAETNPPVAVAAVTPAPPAQKPPQSKPPESQPVATANTELVQPKVASSPAATPVKSTPEDFPSSSPLRSSLSHSQMVWFGVGAASAALLAGGIFLLRGTRKKTGPSLISQSLGGKH